MKLTDKQYKIAAWIGRLLLPGLGTLYATVGALWGWPYTEQVLKTLTALAFFWNSILMIDSGSFFENHEIVPVAGSEEQL